MKILTKYLFKSLLGPLLYCLLAFSLLFIINDLFDNFSDFLGSDIRFLEIVHYYSLIIPPAMVMILPACLLIAMLYSLSQLTRHSEITAMRAGGISIYRIIMPFIGIGIVATAFCATINEKVAPTAGYQAQQVREYLLSGHSDDAYFANEIGCKNGSNEWYVERIDTRKPTELHGVTLRQSLPDGSAKVTYKAEKASWVDGAWWFTDVLAQYYDEKGDLAGLPEPILQKKMSDLAVTPGVFMTEAKSANDSHTRSTQYLSSKEVMHYMSIMTGLPEKDQNQLRVDLHAKMATPFVCLIVTLIGVPVGAHTGRRGAFAGIMTAMVLFFVFYAMQFVFQFIAKSGWMDPWLGGWLPIILFGIGTPFMIHRMR
jgi:lipopolysaccharide export system permease protein